MDIYNYDAETGEYLGACEARIDPLESKNAGHDVYLCPANATFDAPPACGSQEAAVYDAAAGAWRIVPDLRGTLYYLDDGSTGRIAAIDQTIPPDASPDPRPSDCHVLVAGNWEIDLELLRAAKIAATKTEAVGRIAAQVTAWDSLQVIQSIVELWPAIDTTKLSAAHLAARDIYVYAKSKIAAAQAADLAQLEAYDPATDQGWPA